MDLNSEAKIISGGSTNFVLLALRLDVEDTGWVILVQRYQRRNKRQWRCV